MCSCSILLSKTSLIGLEIAFTAHQSNVGTPKLYWCINKKSKVNYLSTCCNPRTSGKLCSAFTCQPKVDVCRQKVWDFTNLKCNLNWRMLTNDELYLSKIFCHCILMKIIFQELIFFPVFLCLDYGWVDFRLIMSLNACSKPTCFFSSYPKF